MTEHRQRLTTEDFAEREPVDREPVEQTPADRDVVEPDLTDQERFDREPVAPGQEHDRQAHDGQVHEHDRQAYDGQGHDGQAYGRQERDGHLPGQDGFGERSHDETALNDGTADDGTATADHDVTPDRDEQVGLRPDEPRELSAVSATAGDAPLFTADDSADYRAEWRALQADFVDDPREAVQRADELVAQVMQSLATTFAQHKHSLEEQWQQGDEVQTEELRQALKRYRSFFDRLLSV